MWIMMIILLLLFCLAVFAVAYALIENKSLKNKFKEKEKERDHEYLAQETNKNRKLRDYEADISSLSRINKKLMVVNSDTKKEIEGLKKTIKIMQDDLTEKESLIESLKSVSISERAFLLDLDN